MLKSRYRIDYKAPMSAAETHMPDGSVDFFYSNNSLEHIPQNAILPILRECRRVLAKTGVVSLKIDYGDHWSYFDKSISPYNYLRYSSKEWKRYNPSLQYQNRLRHSDYRWLLEASGFRLLEDIPFYPAPIEMDALKSLPLAEEFLHYSQEDLSITAGWFVACRS